MKNTNKLHRARRLRTTALFGSWIPVKDRMPTGEDDEEWVLVLTVWGEMNVARKDWEQGHNPDFWHVSGPIRHRLDDVTNWMILPPLPNDKGMATQPAPTLFSTLNLPI